LGAARLLIWQDGVQLGFEGPGSDGAGAALEAPGWDPRGAPGWSTYRELAFRVDGSVPFEESSRFTRTGAPVTRPVGPAIFRPPFFCVRFACTGAIFWGAARLALWPVGVQLGFEGPGSDGAGAASETPGWRLMGGPG